MSINVRSSKQLTGGTRFTREVDSDAHYNDLLSNELLTKAEFPSGVHEVISDPTSNTNPTREFYQLSILSGSTIAGDLFINVPGNVPAIADVIGLAANASVRDVAIAVRTSIDNLHGDPDDDPRFVGIDLSFNIINFSTMDRGDPNDHTIKFIPSNGSYTETNVATGVSWRLDIISAASNAGENTEIILDAGIFTGVS